MIQRNSSIIFFSLLANFKHKIPSIGVRTLILDLDLKLMIGLWVKIIKTKRISVALYKVLSTMCTVQCTIYVYCKMYAYTVHKSL